MVPKVTCRYVKVFSEAVGSINVIKSILISSIAAKHTHVPESHLYESINILIEMMANALGRGERIEIRGFGSFSLHYHPPRCAHNPKTGEQVVTQGKYTPHFKAGKELRERINAAAQRGVLIHTASE